ncbi:class I SAM-dependent methyltransferase [Tateyamaria sp. Alg231-49]|uniref:class I SAM-dependent methyltransferase n=1 Tax=Tateyamaria sp. Alg231-49 TaxID=1922219 RepID=UPI000D55783B|nr:class I SAM-dependent methyltransferase [Tateyamaria sp. Alg231-49]
MITFEEAMQATDLEQITGLNVDALNVEDVVNLILQRSEIIRDQPRYNRYIRAWMNGNTAPVLDLINQIGADVLVRRAAAFVYLEYLQLRPIFEAKPPKAIADIGCGYALFDLFLAKDFKCSLHLIDLETNENRHFGFADEGAAYSSLKVAKSLLTRNGVPAKLVKTLNPSAEDTHKVEGLDYAFSFISCGFHFPWHTYREFFLGSVVEDGRIILDIRSKTLSTVIFELSEIGYVRAVQKAANNSADRMMIRKAGVV